MFLNGDSRTQKDLFIRFRMDTEKPSLLAEKIHAAKERREKLQKERDAARSGKALNPYGKPNIFV